MPYIQPDTRVYILKGVPLDNTYEHTVYYDNATLQLNAFLAYKKYELEKLSYQRTGAGLMRVQLTYEQMYDCNYMIFQNTAYGNKWWYAFITGVAYVNNTTCEISYEIDVMQTWCYDYTFLPTFVDREHVDPDTESFEDFDNYIQPEGLETGSEPIRIQKNYCGGGIHSLMLIATTAPNGASPGKGEMINNTYTPLYMHVWDVGEGLSDTTSINNFIDHVNSYNVNGFAQNIMNLQAGPSDGQDMYTVTTLAISKYWTDGHLAGYTPKNPKLMCYPFHYYTCSNQEGSSIVLRPELVSTRLYAGHTADMMVRVCSLTYPIPMSVLYPVNYNTTHADISGAWDDTTNDYAIDYAIYISDYPTFAVASDAYNAWWAQNKNSYLASQGNISRTYNTEMANIGNSYAQQMVSLKNSYGNNILSANTAYSNSLRSNQTALTNAGYSSAATMLGGAIRGGAEIAGGFLSLDGGAVASGAGMIAQSAIQAATIDEIAKNTANSNNAIATANLHTAASIGSNNFNSGRQIAELAKQASTLSALTNNQNATASLVAKKEDMKNAPDGAIGALTGSSYRTATNNYGFLMFEVCARPEFLRMADNYFEKYGYKIATMKTPDRMNNRPYWHYLQTTGCNIKGNFNVTDISAIKTIYNNGITTWNALENVGNYNMNNHTTTSTLSEENENE